LKSYIYGAFNESDDDIVLLMVTKYVLDGGPLLPMAIDAITAMKATPQSKATFFLVNMYHHDSM
jgi:hypothetical protein